LFDTIAGLFYVSASSNKPELLEFLSQGHLNFSGSVQMAKFVPAPPSESDSLEIQKLKLEIVELRKKVRWQLTPAITALISVAGLLVSVWLFGQQQAANRVAGELERRAALQNRISSEADEILRFPGDPKLTISRVAFLLADIQSVLDSPVNPISVDPKDKQPLRLADALPDEYRDHLTRSLVILVRDECDLSSKPRDAGVARAIYKYWPDYKEYLGKESMGALNYVLWKHTQAVEKFHRQNPGYFESFVSTKEKGIEPGPPFKGRPDEETRWGHLVDLSDGFKDHLKIVCLETKQLDVIEMRQGRFKDFQTNLSKPIVSDFLLEGKTDKESCENILKKEN